MRLIFTVTTGRSGSRMLTEILKPVDGVIAKHEPGPGFHFVMREAQRRPEVAARFWRDLKLPALAELRAATYIETGHVFCKGFLEPLVELGKVPDLIVLRRDPRAVAMSFYHLNVIPGRTWRGRLWLLEPDDPDVLPLAKWQTLHDYQLCYWYCLEIERRARAYSELINRLGGRVAETTIERATTPDGFRTLLHDLALPTPNAVGWARFLVKTRRRVNTKSRRLHSPSDLPLEELEAETVELCGAATQSPPTDRSAQGTQFAPSQ